MRTEYRSFINMFHGTTIQSRLYNILRNIKKILQSTVLLKEQLGLANLVRIEINYTITRLSQ